MKADRHVFIALAFLLLVLVLYTGVLLSRQVASDVELATFDYRVSVIKNLEFIIVFSLLIRLLNYLNSKYMPFLITAIKVMSYLLIFKLPPLIFPIEGDDVNLVYRIGVLITFVTALYLIYEKFGFTKWLVVKHDAAFTAKDKEPPLPPIFR